MRKFILFFTFLLCFTLAIYIENTRQTIFAFEGVFSLYGVGECEGDFERYSLGNSTIISVESARAKSLIKCFKGEVFGYSIKLNKYMDINSILVLLNADIVRRENVCDREIYYCYSIDNKMFVVDNGDKINYQIAFSDGGIVIGCPLILGSY